MNIKEDTMLITLVLVMIALIFAVIAPSTTAEVPLGSPAGFGVNKESYPDPVAAYRVGDTINYSIRLVNDVSAYNANVTVWDILPNGTKLEWQPGNASVYFPKGGPEQWWNYTTTVMADWDNPVTPNPWNTPGDDKFTNVVFVYGRDDNPNFPPETGDTIEAFVQFSSPLSLEIDFDWEPACCKNISFNGWADNEVVNYTWDFGDGETEFHAEDLPGVTFHVYDDCGEYTVTLSGWSLGGDYNEAEKDIYVDCGPSSVTAMADPKCYEKDGTTITFSATATPDGNNPDTLPIVHYEWNFSDEPPGTVHDGRIVEHMVDQDITATVTAYSGLEDDTLCCSNKDTVEVGPCSTEVPVLLPIGLIALVGLLTVIATSTILRKKK
jgi:uncharacterized repeat protein (TIGR01451 family)